MSSFNRRSRLRTRRLPERRARLGWTFVTSPRASAAVPTAPSDEVAPVAETVAATPTERAAPAAVAIRDDDAIVIDVPGDKSIAHRGLMLGAVADGVTRLRGMPAGLDVASTAACMEALGAPVARDGADWTVRGVGAGGLRTPAADLECGNSGTTMRLLCGLLAGRDGLRAVLTGDDSLRSRPMGRVIDPLRTMGAVIGHAGGLAPLEIEGARLTGRVIAPSVASAQVKSALLLAGLAADGPTSVIEAGPTRDHTERMLRAQGARVETDRRTATVWPVDGLAALDLTVPGDLSTAAFWLALGVFGARPVRLDGVGVNPTRTGFVDLLTAAGAVIEVTPQADAGGEPVATLRARPGRPGALDVSGDVVVRAIDEIPLAMILAARIPGVSRFRDAAELRVKETDRIAAVADGLGRLGVRVQESPDGLVVHGGRLRSGVVRSCGDHRIAMGFAILAAVSPEVEIRVAGAEAAAVSAPRFFDQLEAATGARPVVR